jgi:hypothetical protein
MNAPDRSPMLLQRRMPSTMEDVLCFHCLQDDTLRNIIASSGTLAECTACGRIESTLPMAHIATHLDEIIRTTFYGSLPRYDDDDQEAPGADLRCIVRELLGGPHACEDAIIEALIRNDDAFYTHTACYERRASA